MCYNGRGYYFIIMITLNEMHTRFYYDDGVLYYRENISARARKNQPVGSYNNSSGYHRVRYNYKMYYTHRIIYAMHHNIELSEMDGMEVDHIDNDRSNNNIDNLRLITHQENQRNMKVTKEKGVFGTTYYHNHNLTLPDEVRLERNRRKREKLKNMTQEERDEFNRIRRERRRRRIKTNE